jgi:hypothetical protein
MILLASVLKSPLLMYSNVALVFKVGCKYFVHKYFALAVLPIYVLIMNQQLRKAGVEPLEQTVASSC